ncbi:MAG: multicopper oxidase family protein [Coleofasciculus chthonoplastes F3-SA18-01]|uniref:multicopper oxidase family protein n=1 Tax=Coleofasciculus chthonoplastes TaxID=64178 RepID=UPI0033023A50
MNRRQFFFLSSSTAGVILLSQCSAATTKQAPSKKAPSEKLRLSSRRLSSQGGQLDIALNAGYGDINLAGRQAQLYSYNGQVPGPILEAQPGDSVRIQFTNNLPEVTNLHYHGLHVSPTGNADNVFLEIPSGEQLTYNFTIPQNHPAGTFWYHPHLHGLVAKQVFLGLGGLFIVRGELDEIPEIEAAQEEFLVLQDFALDSGGQVITPHPMEQMHGREGQLITVNGQVNPTLSIPSGGLLRLRIANASPSRFYRLSLEEHLFYLIATEGGSISEPIEQQELLLTPGQRVEVLVRGEREPGEYRLLNRPYNRGSMGMMGGGMMGRDGMGRDGMGHGRMGGGMMGRGQTNDSGNVEVLATLSYNGQVEPLPLPKRLIPVDALPEPETTRRFTFSHGMNPGQGMVFLINGKPFDHQRIDTQVQLNTVEDWELVNTGMMDHPIHLHTNHFQVIDRNGQPEPYRAWRDTVLVRVGETVRMRVRFADFLGKTVYHCHILDHEDLGMMGTIEMVS